MNALTLSLAIENKFRKFGDAFPFDRGAIYSHPAESIMEGLRWLQLKNVISLNELEEHLPNYKWNEKNDLPTLMQDSMCNDQLNALLRNLDFWAQRCQCNRE